MLPLAGGSSPPPYWARSVQSDGILSGSHATRQAYPMSIFWRDERLFNPFFQCAGPECERGRFLLACAAQLRCKITPYSGRWLQYLRHRTRLKERCQIFLKLNFVQYICQQNHSWHIRQPRSTKHRSPPAEASARRNLVGGSARSCLRDRAAGTPPSFLCSTDKAGYAVGVSLSIA